MNTDKIDLPDDVMDIAWAAYCKVTSSPTAAVRAAVEAAWPHLAAAGQARISELETQLEHAKAGLLCDDRHCDQSAHGFLRRKGLAVTSPRGTFLRKETSQ